MRDSFSIVELCDALKASRSGYYASRAAALSSRAASSLQLLEHMRSIHAHRHTRSYGSPRMTRQLLDLGLPCSENRVARLMRSDGLRARPRKPFRPKTTDPDHAAHPSPNLLAAEPPARAPGLQLVSDITYIPTREGWLYLAVVMDLFSRSILGWKLSESLHTDLVTAAIQRALSSRLIPKNAIFHSDRGCQYSAASTRQLLTRHGLRQSMSAAGYCYDNAFAESFFASLKADLLLDRHPFASKASAATALFDYLESFYNRRRLHSSLGFLSPSAFLHHHLLASHHPQLLY
jgi:transposase InsO family protein